MRMKRYGGETIRIAYEWGRDVNVESDKSVVMLLKGNLLIRSFPSFRAGYVSIRNATIFKYLGRRTVHAIHGVVRDDYIRVGR